MQVEKQSEGGLIFPTLAGMWGSRKSDHSGHQYREAFHPLSCDTISVIPKESLKHDSYNLEEVKALSQRWTEQ